MGNIVAKRLAEIENKGITLEANDGKIVFKAAKGSLSDEDKAFLKNNKPEVLKYLERDRLTMQDLLKDTEVSPYEKFPLTDIQAAYILGRNNIKYCSVSCKILLEFEYE
jgi:pyochelin synthetase